MKRNCPSSVRHLEDRTSRGSVRVAETRGRTPICGLHLIVDARAITRMLSQGFSGAWRHALPMSPVSPLRRARRPRSPGDAISLRRGRLAAVVFVGR